jgi:tyrocidine synthetase III
MKINDKSEELTIAASQSFKEREYWLKKLSGEIVKSNFPYDYKLASLIDAPVMETKHFKLIGDDYDQLMKLSNGSDSRLHMILIAATMILIYKYTGNLDIILGTPVEKQDIEGDFINTVLTLRNDLETITTFKQLLLQVRKTLVEAIENQNYPIETLLFDLGLVSEKDPFALFDVAVLIENIHDRVYLDNTRCNVIFSYNRTDDSIQVEVEYNSRMYDDETIDRVIHHLNKIYREVLTNIDCEIRTIPLMSDEEETQLLVDFNRKGAAISPPLQPEAGTIYQLFEAQVAKDPSAPALVFEGQTLSYQELNHKANQLAYTLQDKGVKPDDIVGIMVERSLEMVIGMIAIMKAGAAYLPLDPEYPRERILYMMKDSKMKLLLSAKNLKLETDFREDYLDLESSAAFAIETANLEPVANNDNTAYIIYTSGSTGEPKGVIIKHHSIINTLNWRKRYYQFDQTDAVLQLPSFSFDSSVEDIFTPLISGSTLVLIEEQKRFDMDHLADLIRDNHVTHFLIIPNLYSTFLGEIPLDCLQKMKSVTVAGDNFTEELVKAHYYALKDVILYNEYGPTENSVCSTVYQFSDSNTRVLIGKPIDNVNCYILDSQLSLLPIGVPGELCVSGSGLAAGYFGGSQLSAEKFIPHPFETGQRMYRTGDLARWMPDGNIEFMGRIDHQVKIRGVRIELGEIESQLLRYEFVKEAVVIAREDINGDKYLSAYMVMKDPNTELDVAAVIEFLLQSLPDYVIPAYFFKIDKIPVTPNGKIDRKGLPEPEGDLITGVEFVAPRTEMETKLENLWKEELKLEKIGVLDNYFTIGGDSIKSIKLVSLINKKFSGNLKIVDLYVNNSIEKLATLMESGKFTQTGDGEELVAAQSEVENLKDRIMGTTK